MLTEVETGVSDDQWIEVTNRRTPVPPEAPGDSVPWTAIDGSEQVILGDLSGLAEGALWTSLRRRPNETRGQYARPRSEAKHAPVAGRCPASGTSRPAKRLP